MSLLIRLPLNGNLENRGSANVAVTNISATVNNEGKLGKCYYFDRSIPSYLKFNNPITSNISTVSMAFWVKIPSNAVGNNQIVHIGNGAGWNNNRFTCLIYQSSSSLVFSCGDGTDSTTSHNTTYNCKSSALTLNKWTHVACIYNNGVMQIYLDGVKDVEYTTSIVPNFTGVSYVGVGAAPNANEPATVYVNDVRIYNHCLSDHEVKQLIKGKGLQVWLPLNGNIDNQGLLNWTPTIQSGTTATYVDGKIGQGLNTGGIVMPASITSQILNNDTFSYTCWIKVLGESGSTSQRAMIFGNDSMSALGGRQFSLFQYSTANDLHYSWQNYDGSTYSSAYGGVLSGVLPSNQWTHIAVVYNKNDTERVKIYINGEKVLGNSGFISSSVSFSYDTQLIWNSQYHVLNDIRLYDCALSEKEIKEIAKGLILHYKLGGPGGENLLSKYCTPGQQNPGVTTSAGQTNYYGDYGIVIPTTTNADTYFRLFLNKQLTSGQTYTISCYVSGLIEGTFYNFPLFAQNNTAMGVLTLNKNGMNSLTFTMSYTTQTGITVDGRTVYIMFMDDSVRNIASGQGAITISHFKLEEGSKATPWCPEVADSKYSMMGYGNNIEYDISGYKNNGTKTNIIECSSDSPKFYSSYKFNGTDYITLPLTSSTKLYEELTISFWMKRTTNASTRSFLYEGIISSYIEPSYNGGYPYAVFISWNHANSSTSYNANTWLPGYETPLNTWVHLAFTFDRGVWKLYVNGQYYNISDRSNTGTYICGRRGNTIGAQNTGGHMSDIKIYATAFSATDIAELYNQGH